MDVLAVLLCVYFMKGGGGGGRGKGGREPGKRRWVGKKLKGRQFLRVLVNSQLKCVFQWAIGD